MKSIDEICKTINKEYKEEIVVPASEVEPPRFIPTGVFDLDMALGGGLVANRISEFLGEFSSCKTTVSYFAAKNFLDLSPNGFVFIVDAERTYDPRYLKRIGIPQDRFRVYQPTHGEEAGDVISKMLKGSDRDVLIIIDSVAALRPIKEDEENTEKGMVGVHPRLVNRVISKILPNMRKKEGHFLGHTVLMLNQTRKNIGVLFGDNTTGTGGQGREFYYSQQVYFKNTKKLREDGVKGESSFRKQDYASVITVKVKKNKTGAHTAEAEFVYYTQDHEDNREFTFDNASSFLQQGQMIGAVEKVTTQKWKISCGEFEFEGLKKDTLKFVRENEEELCAALLLMKYPHARLEHEPPKKPSEVEDGTGKPKRKKSFPRSSIGSGSS